MGHVISERRILTVELKNKLGKEILFFDGAMGTMLQKKGHKLGKMPEDLNIDNPEIIEEIHSLYVNSGALRTLFKVSSGKELKLDLNLISDVDCNPAPAEHTTCFVKVISDWELIFDMIVAAVSALGIEGLLLKSL